MTNEQFIAEYGNFADMRIVDGNATVSGSLNLTGCTSLTALPDGLTVGRSLDLTGCTSLTHWGKHRLNWRNVDGYSMRIISKPRQIGVATVERAEWLRDIAPGKPLKQCYIATIGDHSAHGKTIAEAINDARFKAAEHEDKDELARTIKQRGTVLRMDFRVLTGACEAGLRVGMADAGLDPDAQELPLDVVMAKAHGQFGDAFRRMMEAV